MSKHPTLRFGCTFSDRIEAILDGRAAVDGLQLNPVISEPQSLFGKILNGHSFDVAELSMGSYIASVAGGRNDYIALPIFLSRSFRHSNLYIRSDRGIDCPEALAGKRIGLIDFQQTAALWIRGLLADEHGVQARSIHWTTGGLHAPVLTDRMPSSAPEGIDIVRTSRTLDEMLSQGDLDAVISPTVPRSFRKGDGLVVRMWPDYRKAEADYWRRCRIFPIMHVLVLRRDLAEVHHALPAALFDIFEQALMFALRDVMNRDFPKLALPWLIGFGEDSSEIFGDDLWTYGVGQNAAVIDTMLRYAVRDGLCGSDMTKERLFPFG